MNIVLLYYWYSLAYWVGSKIKFWAFLDHWQVSLWSNTGQIMSLITCVRKRTIRNLPVCHIRVSLSHAGFRVRLSHSGSSVTFGFVCHIRVRLSLSGSSVTFGSVCHFRVRLSHSGSSVTFGFVCHIRVRLSHSGSSVTFGFVCHIIRVRLNFWQGSLTG
jgi:hypothetical protein